MAKKEKKYILYTIMNKDIEVVKIQSNGICKILNFDMMPFDIWLEESNDFDECINNISVFNSWCSKRLMPSTRKLANIIFSSIGIRKPDSDIERRDVAIRELHCATIVDSFWVKVNDEDLNWKNVNLFDKIIKDEDSIKMFLEGKKVSGSSPSLSPNGEAQKCLSKEKENNVMIKCDISEGTSKNEILASKLCYIIAKEFNVKCVNYNEYEENKFNICNLETNKNTGFVSYQQMEIRKVNVGIYKYIDEKINIEELKKRYELVIDIIDYITYNNDRHSGNIGYLVDNDTNKIINYMPIFDFNYCFFNYETIKNGDFERAYDKKRILENLKELDKETKEKIIKTLEDHKQDLINIIDKYNTSYREKFIDRMEFLINKIKGASNK